MTDEAKTVDVLIVAGPHAGRVHEHLNLSDEFALVTTTAGAAIYIESDADVRGLTVQNAVERADYRVYEAHMPTPDGVTMWLVALPVADERDPSFVAVAFALDHAFALGKNR
jgi:hypothetical protein